MDHDTISTGPPPGWYPDRADPSRLRWWDGAHWAEATRPSSTPAVPARRTAPSAATEGRTTALVVDLEPEVRVPWRALVAVVAAVVLVLGAAAGVRHLRTPATSEYAAAVCAKASASVPAAMTATSGVGGIPPDDQARHAAFVAVSFAAALANDLPSSGTSIVQVTSWREEVNTAASQLTEAADQGAAPELQLRRRALADRTAAAPVPPAVLAALREAPACARLWAALRGG